MKAQGELWSVASTTVFSRLVWQCLFKAKNNPILGMVLKGADWGV